MSSRGSSFASSTRTRKSIALFWAVLFVLSIGLQYVSAVAPRAALAAAGDPVVTLEDGVNGCQGVRTTPGSENTDKRLIGGSLVPGGTATFRITYPVDPADVAGRTTFVITDCVFIDGNAVLKYSVSFVPNTVDYVLTFDLVIPAGTPIGSEYCNYAKTTAAPSTSQASNRKAGPACFIVGGNLSILKTDEAGHPLAGATFHIVCTLPTTTAFLPTTIINGVSFTSTNGGVIDTHATTGDDGRIVIQAPVGTSCVITETGAPAGYQIAADRSVTLVATAGGVSHTFVNVAETPHLSIVKDASPANYDSVGDVITYSITATNDGNVTLHNVTITDPNATGLSCTPTIPVTDLAVGGTIVCTASHTITQADIDAGHYLNTACVNDGAGGAAQACDDADVPSVKTPHLSIVKDASPANYDSVGDVITYSITATNDGNTTLASVTVTDANATSLSCTPANGSSLAPGASMVCTASHTVTQVDIDAGHYLNTACGDDGANGAAQACDDADVNSDQNPHLSIVKDATESTYDSVGDVIHYSITATNDGNVTLHNVTITDPNATGLSCTPAIPVTDLAPAATIVCTASHTVTQADIDAGHYLNTACVDDGANGAAQACDDANVPATSNNHLSIVKTATEANYDAVGDVIHYSITATNDGNTTLESVTVTDANAIDLSCTPANGSSLAPAASLVCTASHAVTQADIDAGHYLNTACVSATGASATCDDADVPSNNTPHLSIVKNATEASYDAVGDVIHYSITATNDGNTTLASVIVTDANATGLSCTPANGSSLAPAATMTCTASHTITQADLDAGHYLNTACVDATGATAACDSADVSVATLTITKTNNAPIVTLVLPDGSTADLPTADEGTTVTYTLAYNVGDFAVSLGVIEDVLPAGLEYVTGSATSNGTFTFAGYDSTTRTLTWTAARVNADGSVTYQAKVLTGASALSQPLTNTATIRSEQTAPSSDTSDVFVPVIPQGETNVPTAPPTDTLGSTTESTPSSSLFLMLAVLGALVIGIGFVTPVPAVVRRRNRR